MEDDLAQLIFRDSSSRSALPFPSSIPAAAAVRVLLLLPAFVEELG